MPGLLGLQTTALAPLTEKQLRDAQRDKVYIFNVSPNEYRSTVEKIYVIPARAADQEYSAALEIPGIVYSTYSKAGSPEWFPRDGIEVAQEIVGTFRMLDPSQNMTPYGVFISETPIPSDEAVERAKTLWLETCSRRVSEADRLAAINGGNVDMGQGRTASNIGEHHRQALKELGLSRSWSGKNVRMVECEQCGTANMPKAAMCRGCDAVFNEDEARRLYPQKFASRGPGRPRNEPIQ
jgi:hypothetical protein